MDTTDTLLRILDANADEATAKYRDLFRRLLKFFQWRHFESPEDLAQETLRRGFGRILAGVTIDTDPAHYFFGIARNVAYEEWKRAAREPTVSLDELPSLAEVDFRDADARILLQQYLDELEPAERQLLVRYHTEDRTALADELRIPEGTLRVRAFRAKRKLEQWIKKAEPSGTS